MAGFEILTDSKYLTSDVYLLAGDILLNDVYHTAINLTNGSKAESSDAGNAAVYTVAKGDTLSQIGTELCVNWKDIAEINGIKDPYTITVGQVLKIPNTSTTATNTSSAKIAASPVFAQYFEKTLAGTYIVSTQKDPLIMRVDAGTDKTPITSIPKGAKVQCYGYYNTSGGTKWLLVLYNGKTGFASGTYLKKQ